jgi:hypothetical protein
VTTNNFKNIINYDFYNYLTLLMAFSFKDSDKRQNNWGICSAFSNLCVDHLGAHK